MPSTTGIEEEPTTDGTGLEPGSPTPPSPATPPADALDRHVRFFDINGDGRITIPEIYEGMLELGFSKLTSVVVAPILGALLPSNVADIAKVRHADSSSFTKDGNFDDAAFERWFAATDHDGSGGLTRFELLKSSLALADSPMTFIVSTGEFQLMYTIVARDGQASKAALRDFFSGALLDKIIARRKAAPPVSAAP